MTEPKRVTVQDIIDYHQHKDWCHTCNQHEWWCPQHHFDHNYKDAEPRYVSVVDDGFRSAIPLRVDITPK